MSAPVLTHRLALPLRLEPTEKPWHGGAVTTADDMVPNLTLVVNECNTLVAERDAALREVEVKTALAGTWYDEGVKALQERDAALAEVARMRPVVEAAVERRAIHLAAGDDEGEQERRGLLLAEVAEDAAVDTYRAKEAPDA